MGLFGRVRVGVGGFWGFGRVVLIDADGFASGIASGGHGYAYGWWTAERKNSSWEIWYSCSVGGLMS